MPPSYYRLFSKHNEDGCESRVFVLFTGTKPETWSALSSLDLQSWGCWAHSAIYLSRCQLSDPDTGRANPWVLEWRPWTCQAMLFVCLWLNSNGQIQPAVICTRPTDLMPLFCFVLLREDWKIRDNVAEVTAAESLAMPLCDQKIRHRPWFSYVWLTHRRFQRS